MKKTAHNELQNPFIVSQYWIHPQKLFQDLYLKARHNVGGTY